MQTDIEQDLRALLADYESRWNRRKPTELRELWDSEETIPFYIAEEIASPLYGWEEIEPYWREAEEILVKFSVRSFDLRWKEVAPGLVVMNYIMHWNGIVRGMEQSPLGLDVRVSALVRHTPDGWRYCHYVESPLGAFPYLQASYRANVDAEFLD